MPRFHKGRQAKPEEVTVDVGEDGSTARVLSPKNARSSLELDDLRLSAALAVARMLAERLGTQVCVIDPGDHIYIVDDPSSLIAS